MLASTQLAGLNQTINPNFPTGEEILRESSVPQPPSVDELKSAFSMANVEQKAIDEETAVKYPEKDDICCHDGELTGLVASFLLGTAHGAFFALCALGVLTTAPAFFFGSALFILTLVSTDRYNLSLSGFLISAFIGVAVPLSL